MIERVSWCRCCVNTPITFHQFYSIINYCDQCKLNVHIAFWLVSRTQFNWFLIKSPYGIIDNQKPLKNLHKYELIIRENWIHSIPHWLPHELALCLPHKTLRNAKSIAHSWLCIFKILFLWHTLPTIPFRQLIIMILRQNGDHCVFIVSAIAWLPIESFNCNVMHDWVLSRFTAECYASNKEMIN